MTCLPLKALLRQEFSKIKGTHTVEWGSVWQWRKKSQILDMLLKGVSKVD